MTTRHITNIGLAINAVILGAIWLSGRAGTTASAAPAAEPRPSGPLVVMPGQISVNGYGCYLLDADNQTLLVYQYVPGERDLKFLAARDVSADRLMKNFNTSPPPAEIRQRIEEANNAPKTVAPH